MKILLFLCMIMTSYTNKTFSTVCAVEVDAPAEISDTILARFIHDFQTSPDALFDWAFYGVGTQENEEKNAFLLEYKLTEYIPEKNYGRVVTDIVIPHLTRFKDITLEGVVLDSIGPMIYNPALNVDSLTMATIPNWIRHIDIDVHYSGKLLEHGYGNLFIIPINKEKSVFLMDINLRYGWFFNIFVTMKVYKNSVEWRVKRYMENLKNVAEQLYINADNDF